VPDGGKVIKRALPAVWAAVFGITYLELSWLVKPEVAVTWLWLGIAWALSRMRA
jgi:hypothetical protein